MGFNGDLNPLLVAWNWSFAPLDLLASACGLWALRPARRQDAHARPRLSVALVLTFCAGSSGPQFLGQPGRLRARLVAAQTCSCCSPSCGFRPG